MSDHRVSVVLKTVVQDKTSAAIQIARLSAFQLEESNIKDLTVENGGQCKVIVSCPSISMAKKLVSCINPTGQAVAALLSSKSTEENGAKRHQQQKLAGRHTVAQKQVIPKAKVASSQKAAGFQRATGMAQGCYVVYIRFSELHNLQEATEYIQRNGFQMNDDVIELDVFGGCTTAYGVLVKCETKNVAENLVLQLNRRADVNCKAVLLSSPLENILPDSVLCNIETRSSELICAHTRKGEDVCARLNELFEVVNAAKRGKKWLDMREFELKEATLKPLREKGQELILQQNEFTRELGMLKDKIESMKVNGSGRVDLLKAQADFQLEMDQFRAALPMYGRKSDIVKTVQENQVSVILGETGSGKSTQILQYLHNAGLSKRGTIVCTQPRKVAAVSLACRVAEEMRSNVGELVGYRVGMQSKCSSQTKLLYVTDHTLLNDCLKDRTLLKYSCIVIDEAHERSIFTDLLLGFIKLALPQRADLRVVIMSATINPDLFVSYFTRSPVSSSADAGRLVKPPPVMRVSGRAFPVDVVFKRVAVDDYVTEAVDKVVEVHRSEPPGDILVFLTSPIETQQALKKLNNHPGCDRNVIVLEMHGRLQIEDQRKVFDETPTGKRKVVFATNSAETSITIPGIKYVIDTGKVRELKYDAKRNISELAVQWVTQSSAEQRKGRAGRTDCGKCFRLYSEEQYRQMRADSVPEILRVHLGQAILKLMMLGISEPSRFDFVEAPENDAMISALAVLTELEACKNGAITELGEKLSKLSLEPRLGKVALRGIDEGIAFESIVMAAVSTVGGSIFFRGGPEEQKQLADRQKARFCDEWGDLITLVNVYREWDRLPEGIRNKWCKENSINAKSMRLAKTTINEIVQTFKLELGINVVRTFSNDSDVNEKMAKILFDCYPSNLSRFCGHKQEGYMLASSPSFALSVHPSSALNYLEDWPRWIIYEKVLTTTRTYMLNATFVQDSWVAEKMEKGTLKVCVEDVEQFVVSALPSFYVGSRFIRLLLTDKARVKKELENAIKSDDDSAKAVIDLVTADNGGKLTVYTTAGARKRAQDTIDKQLSETAQEMLNQTDDVMFLPNSGVRVVVERGIQVRMIMMPGESRTLKVRNVRFSNDPRHTVVRVLSKFGQIESVRVDNRSNDEWVAYVYFKKPEEAEAAIANRSIFHSQFDADLHVGFSSQSKSAHRPSDFVVKVIGQRRALMGFGYVSFDDEFPLTAALALGSFSVTTKPRDGVGSYAQICLQLDKKSGRQLYLKPVPSWATNEIITAGLLEAMDIDDGIQNVNLPRARPPSHGESQRMCAEFRACIANALQMSGEISNDDYNLDVKEPKEKDYDMRAFLKFTDPNKARRAAKILRNVPYNYSQLTATVELKVSLFVPKYVYNSIKQFIDRAIRELRSETVEDLNIESCESYEREKSQTPKSIVFKISTGCLGDLILAKDKIGSLLNGFPVKLDHNQIRYLKTTNGQKLLESLRNEMHTFLRLDERQGVVYIHGFRDHVTETEQRLAESLRNTDSLAKRCITLSSPCYPRGLLKAVIREFGADLEKLKMDCKAADVDLVIRRHMLRCYGSAESCETFEKLLNQLASSLPGQRVAAAGEDSLPECPICLGEVEKDAFYVTEYCRHVYCKTCFDGLLKNAIDSNEIPIKCAAGECNLEIVLQDVWNVYGKSCRRVYDAAIRTFVQEHGNEYSNCISANCQMIYRRAPNNEEGKKFQCSECGTAICTSCNDVFHDGLSCAVSRNYKQIDRELRQWLADDTRNRSLCPQCGVGIEKDGGCDHMECKKCKIHICWACKATFSNSSDCYKHMRERHQFGLVYGMQF